MNNDRMRQIAGNADDLQKLVEYLSQTMPREERLKQDMTFDAMKIVSVAEKWELPDGMSNNDNPVLRLAGVMLEESRALVRHNYLSHHPVPGRVVTGLPPACRDIFEQDLEGADHD